MRKLIHAVAATALVTTAAAGFTTATATQASADPVVPCGSKSTKVFDYYNLTYKNCSSFPMRVRPYAMGLGFIGECKAVAVGKWVQWTHLPRPAIGGYEARNC